MTSLRSHNRGTATAGPEDRGRARPRSHDRRRPADWLKARVRPDDRVRNRIKIIVKVGNVLDKILTQNNSFDVASYPDLRVNHRRSATQYAKDFKFYITADYDFEKQIWKSWWFEIESDRWKDSETKEYKYPVLLDRFYFYKDPVRSAEQTAVYSDIC